MSLESLFQCATIGKDGGAVGARRRIKGGRGCPWTECCFSTTSTPVHLVKERKEHASSEKVPAQKHVASMHKSPQRQNKDSR